MKPTSLRAWLGLPRWLVIGLAIALAIAPAIRISTDKPLEIKITIGGSK